MDDIVKRIRQQSYFWLEPYEAADEIEQLRQRVQELTAERDELLAFVEEVRRTGDTRLASMAITAIASVKEKA